jgi:hypothetical protein
VGAQLAAHALPSRLLDGEPAQRCDAGELVRLQRLLLPGVACLRCPRLGLLLLLLLLGLLLLLQRLKGERQARQRRLAVGRVLLLPALDQQARGGLEQLLEDARQLRRLEQPRLLLQGQRLPRRLARPVGGSAQAQQQRAGGQGGEERQRSGRHRGVSVAQQLAGRRHQRLK